MRCQSSIKFSALYLLCQLGVDLFSEALQNSELHE